MNLGSLFVFTGLFDLPVCVHLHHYIHLQVSGMDCFVARCGYTGEDGFEIFVPQDHAVKMWQLLCQQPEVFGLVWPCVCMYIQFMTTSS
jgi:aminomethyltransferase